MIIKKKIKVPTGEIYIAELPSGLKTEFLSLADYGQDKNVKADFLGLTKEINSVNSNKTMPLTEKWVITISSQPGCLSTCRFCDVWKYRHTSDILSYEELIDQVLLVISQHPEVGFCKRLNLHYARMGEPTLNNNIFYATEYLYHFFNNKKWTFHPVISTMMPKYNKDLEKFICKWLGYKNILLSGEAGLQISINTTEENMRNWQFRNMSYSLDEISKLLNSCIYKNGGVNGRKIALNFAITDDTIVNAEKLSDLFCPAYFMCKITPIHKTFSSEENNIKTTNGYEKYYPYSKIENNLKNAGFDVLVFIPSIDEDESRITCGNAILSNMEV